jgi:hypothetical protein
VGADRAAPNHVLADAQPTVVLHIQQPPGTDVLTFNAGTIDP